MSWKLIIPVAVGVVLAQAATRFAFHQPIFPEVLIAAGVSVIAGMLLSLLVSIRRKPKGSMH